MAGGSRSELGSSRGDATVRRLGRYQIIGRLATGGMAEVYLALSGDVPGFRTLVVVKRILPHLASNAQFIRMFLDEARLAALLDHPNIVRIIEVGHDGEDYFLVMELVQGKPLSARAAQGGPRAQAARTGADVLSDLAGGPRAARYAHALTDGDGRPLGVVHRDVSPQNVLISFEGAVKMIDFGVARAFGRVAHTSPGGLKGKIDYMSPEQASAEEVDHRADVFALGVVLWEALTGRRLFRRDTELATMRAIVDDPIPHPAEIAPSIPADLDAIVMRALRKRKDARYASAQEMAAALERFAFSNEGFSPMQVAAYTKSLFAAEYLQWRKTATAALDLEVEKPHQGEQAMGGIGAEPPTAGPTMALRPGVSWQEGRSEMRSATSRSRSRSSPSQGQGNAQRGSQSAYSHARSAGGPGGRNGRRRGAQAQSHLAVCRRRRAAGHRRRWCLDADAAPGDLGAGQPLAAPAAPAAMGGQDRQARAAGARTAGRRSRARPPNLRPRRHRARSCRPCPPSQTRLRRPAADSASWKALSRPAKSKSRAVVTNYRPRAGRRTRPTATQKEKATSSSPTSQKPTPSPTDGPRPRAAPRDCRAR